LWLSSDVSLWMFLIFSRVRRPVLGSSGRLDGGVIRHGRITREDGRWLRRAVVEAAMTHIKYDTSITRAYHRTLLRGGVSKLLLLLLPVSFSFAILLS